MEEDRIMNQSTAVKQAWPEVEPVFTTEYRRENIGMHTYRFVRRLMRDPAIRQKIQELSAQLDQEGENHET